ncbi:uncharacterized protein LOC111326350 [Stylophora pistillata]|uniref:uncharacterized protein LOC111326350 n=1 Tax=Stylophora pistillata TaxID=50429 RepID=UPI000C0483EF|nr:uncharacterized protein LOC111326350 [Stylophora pistillata]
MMANGEASDAPLEKPLSDKHRHILKNVEEAPSRDMDPEELLRKMAAVKVLFTQSEAEKIKAKQTRSGKCEELLEILSRKGEKAYQIFKKVLRDVHPPLANIILERESMDLGRDEKPEQADRARPVPDSTEIKKLREKVVTLQGCMSIQDDAGNCWRELGAYLQIPEGELCNIEKQHRLAKDSGYAVLQSWRNRKGSDATVGCLSDAFESIGKKRIAEKLLGV